MMTMSGRTEAAGAGAEHASETHTPRSLAAEHQEGAALLSRELRRSLAERLARLGSAHRRQVSSGNLPADLGPVSLLLLDRRHLSGVPGHLSDQLEPDE